MTFLGKAMSDLKWFSHEEFGGISLSIDIYFMMMIIIIIIIVTKFKTQVMV